MTFLNENEILDYLMTSDFNEGLTQEEFRFFLLKFRYHYRVLYSRLESQRYLLDEKIELVNELTDKINKLENLINLKDEEIKNEINRKLTLRERLTGKKLLK